MPAVKVLLMLFFINGACIGFGQKLKYFTYEEAQNCLTPDSVFNIKLSGNIDTSAVSFLKFRQLSYLGLEDWTKEFDFLYEIKTLEKLYFNRSSNVTTIDFSKLSGLKYLGFYKCKLGKVPITVFSLSNLEELYLSCNQLDEIPEEIEKLSKLKVLNLGTISSNYCDDLLDKSQINLIKFLPESIGNLVHLANLDISDCPISELPASFEKLLHIGFINIRGSSLTDLPDYLRKEKEAANRISICYSKNNVLNPNDRKYLKKLKWQAKGQINCKVGDKLVFYTKKI